MIGREASPRAHRIALELAQRMLPDGGLVLVVVPTVRCLVAAHRCWVSGATLPLRPFAIAAFVPVSASDLAPTIDPAWIAAHASLPPTVTPRSLTVAFTTYRWLDIVVAAQQQGVRAFDLMLCSSAFNVPTAERALDRVADIDRVATTVRLHVE